MEIVTGCTGRKHVTPIDDAVRNSNTGYYGDKVVFDVFEKFEARAITANEVRVYSGYGMNQGRYFKVAENDYDSVTIENGSVGVKRMDLITARYTMNQQTGYESIDLHVIRGESNTDNYIEPQHETGSINSGDTVDDFVLYKVYIDGIVIDHIEAAFTPLPDGGRLGEIEADFEALEGHFNELQGQFNLIPAEVAAAASRTYVNGIARAAARHDKVMLYSAYETNDADCQRFNNENQLTVRNHGDMAYSHFEIVTADGKSHILGLDKTLDMIGGNLKFSASTPEVVIGLMKMEHNSMGDVIIRHLAYTTNGDMITDFNSFPSLNIINIYGCYKDVDVVNNYISTMGGNTQQDS